MTIEDLRIDEVPYLYDQSGRILLKDEKVFRIIEDQEHVNNYKEILSSDYIEDLFSVGLVRTQIREDLSSSNKLILEHKKIPFILHPCEYSNEMFWRAAFMFVQLNLELSKHGFITHDSHPWNISFDGTRPVFYDFGSIIKSNKVTKAWFDEFFYYFIVPIWLASFSVKTFKYSKEYRREHLNGFGLNFFKSSKVEKLLFWKFKRLLKFKYDPSKLFNEILEWLNHHKPISVKPEYWSDYYKGHGLDYVNPKSVKQKFVYEILSKVKPTKVLDLASNKGYYAFMAASFGASVMAFDYEEEIVDYLLNAGIGTHKITPVHMDFKNPTSEHGIGLSIESSFQRFNSEVVLALGLIHHICLSQKVPVFVFCEICKKYASKGVVLEFVDPTDMHVKAWDVEQPKDYSIDKIKLYMREKFLNCTESENILSDGINRTYLYFYN